MPPQDLQQSKKPAEPPKVLNPEEAIMKHKMDLLAKVKVIRERMATVHGEVLNKRDNKVYVWVNKDENRQIHYQTLGFELCKDEQVQSNWKLPDNTHRRGDLVLYQVDKDLHEAISMEGELRAIESVEGARGGFRATAQQHGVPIYEPLG